MYISALDIGHLSDDRAMERSDVYESFSSFFNFVPADDARAVAAERARLEEKRSGDGGTSMCRMIMLADQGYPGVRPLSGTDILCTRTAEDADEWAKAKDKAYVRVSSKCSKVRSVIERIFGRLSNEAPFVTGPIYESQAPLAYNYTRIFMSLYNRRIDAGEALFAKDDST